MSTERTIVVLEQPTIHAGRLRDADVFVPLGFLYEKFHEGAVYLLAERLAPGYMRPVTFNPMGFMRKLQAAYLIVPDVQMPSAIRSTAPHRRWRR